MGDQPPVLSYSDGSGPKLEIPCGRVGPFLVTGTHAILPKRCVICGAESEGPPTEKVIDTRKSFHMGGSDKVTLMIYFCARHDRMAKLGQRAQFIISLCILGVLVVGVCLRYGLKWSVGESAFVTLIVLGVALAILSMMILAVITTRGPQFERKDGSTYLFSAVHPRVLEMLPELGK